MNTLLRFTLIAVFFAAGIAVTVIGWRMTGNLAGLGLMVAGTALLLAALYVYNKPFETPEQ